MIYPFTTLLIPLSSPPNRSQHIASPPPATTSPPTILLSSEEIRLLYTIHHHNLIHLTGVCFDDGHWYLVYEFAVNGPLSDWIYYNALSGNKSLNWMQRVQIALGVANGLAYLHSYTTPPYVYKNLESGNILLDGDFRPKITNFDLAMSAEGQEGQFALTRHIVDVYGFGVLLLEIVTGKHVSDLYEKVNKNLSEVLYDVLQEENTNTNEKLTGFIDQRLQGNYPPQLTMYVVKLIDGCLSKDPSARPDMNRYE
ncbi:putative protein kinase RLK-Pelle-LysM family [Helianthus anomalus]